MIVRLGVWLGLLLAMLAGGWRLQLAFPAGLTSPLFPPKLTFLGLVMTVGTFQYRVWVDVLHAFQTEVHNPNWARFEQEFKQKKGEMESGAGPAFLLAPWESELERWHRFVRDRTTEMRARLLPAHRAILANLLFVGACLLLSVFADLGVMLLGKDVTNLRILSSATFLIAFLPFIEIWGRYLLVLRTEFNRIARQVGHRSADARLRRS